MIYIWSLLVFFALHILATIVIFFRLKALLRKTNLNGYKRILGVYYRQKPGTNGETKYQWNIGLITVRVSFDGEERPLACEIKPYRFFPLSYKQSAI